MQCQAEVPLTVEEIAFTDPRCSARFEYGPDRGVGKGIISYDFSGLDTPAPAIRRNFKLENTIPKKHISGNEIMRDWGRAHTVVTDGESVLPNRA